MTKIFSNIELNLHNEGEIWKASNGATRRTLMVINKINHPTTNVFYGKLGFLDKGNHSFIFINEDKTNKNDVLGLFLNSDYGYQVIEGNEIFSNESVGGVGNSCSKFGIYSVGTILEVNSYKNRNTPKYFKLNENGWVNVPVYDMVSDEINVAVI